MEPVGSGVEADPNCRLRVATPCGYKQEPLLRGQSGTLPVKRDCKGDNLELPSGDVDGLLPGRLLRVLVSDMRICKRYTSVRGSFIVA